MKKNKDFSITELFMLICIFSFVLFFAIHIEMQKKHGQINHLIADIQKYKTAINEFNRKYGFLPGDLKKTEVFNLSVHNTDGNENGLIEDANQIKGDYTKNIQGNGEILNFWLHLYKSKFIPKQKNIFPYIDFLNSGILVFTDGKDNYFNLSIDSIDQNLNIKTKYNLMPYHAYLIDKKIDDSLPIDGDVFIMKGRTLNINNMRKSYKDCATDYEYLTIYKKKLCQLAIKF